MELKKVISVIAGLGLAAVTLSAQAANNGLYVGASAGHSSMDYTASNQNFKPGKTDGNDGLGWSAFLGYQMNRNFALQADYIQYHDAKFKDIFGINNANAEYKQSVGDVVGKLIFPLGNGFNIFATGGLAYVKLDRSENSTAKAFNINLDNKDALRPTYGVGAGYNFYTGWEVQVAWSQIPSGGNIEQSNYFDAALAFHFA